MGLKIVPQTDQRLVTAAGTPERLLEAGVSFQNRIVAITIRALTDNAANIYLGNSPTEALSTNLNAYILAPGETISLDVHDYKNAHIDLSDLWIDSTVNDDGVCIIYFEVP